MPSPQHDVSRPDASPFCEPSAGCVPQEHLLPAHDSAPRDWSQLGRWVLAEAWRRFTDDAGLHAVVASPIVSTPVSVPAEEMVEVPS